jgi:ribosomal protein S18 acetylase RimI-like enzyme
VSRIDDFARAAGSQALKLRISLAQGGLRRTLYSAAFGYLRPNRFHVLRRDLAETIVPRPGHPDLRVEAWDAARVRRWRAGRHGLRLEFFRDEVDGVDTCFVATVGDEVAGLIWLFPAGRRTRIFELGPGEAEINYGCVLPAYRGLGTFRSILSFACDHVRAAGGHTVWAAVHEANPPSLRAFRAAGFRDAGTVRHLFCYRPRYLGGGIRPPSDGRSEPAARSRPASPQDGAGEARARTAR